MDNDETDWKSVGRSISLYLFQSWLTGLLLLAGTIVSAVSVIFGTTFVGLPGPAQFAIGSVLLLAVPFVAFHKLRERTEKEIEELRIDIERERKVRDMALNESAALRARVAALKLKLMRAEAVVVIATPTPRAISTDAIHTTVPMPEAELSLPLRKLREIVVRYQVTSPEARWDTQVELTGLDILGLWGDGIVSANSASQWQLDVVSHVVYSGLSFPERFPPLSGHRFTARESSESFARVLKELALHDLTEPVNTSDHRQLLRLTKEGRAAYVQAREATAGKKAQFELDSDQT